MTIRRFAVATLIAALTLTGCSSGNEAAPSAGRQRRGRHHQRHQSAGSRNPAAGRQPAAGADRIPVELQLAAHRRQTGRHRRHAADDDAARVPGRLGRLDHRQHRLLHQCRTDRHRPAGRHLHDQSESGLERRHADHLGRHRLSDPRDQRQGQGVPIASPNGADRVDKVDRGVDDRQAVVTFTKPYAEWRGMFAGNTMLLPKSMTANPEAFNKGSSTVRARPPGRSGVGAGPRPRSESR